MTIPSAGTTVDHQERLAAGQACLVAAQEYLTMGFAVTCCCDVHHIAVGREHGKRCTSPGKSPIHPWKAFQSRLPTQAEVLQYWKNYPLGNVGCVLGQVSGLVRIDTDGESGDATLRAWSQGDLPRTWEFVSGSGGHGWLYGWPRDLSCRTTSQRMPGAHEECRLMANGSQTVLPPSRHESGRLYAWVAGQSPHDLPLAPAPPWLLTRLRADTTGEPLGATALPAALPAVDVHGLGLDQQTLSLLQHGELRYGSRSEGLFAAITRLVKLGFDDATIAAMLLDPSHVAGAKARERGEPWLAQELGRARGAVRKTLRRYHEGGLSVEQMALVLYPHNATPQAWAWLGGEVEHLGGGTTSPAPPGDFIDPWLGPRSQWCGVPLGAVRI